MTSAKKKAVSVLAAVVVAGAVIAAPFVVGGHSSYSATKHRLSMAAGSSDQVNCNGAALTFQQLQPTIGGLTCAAPVTTTSTTSTTVVPGSSTTVTTQPPLPPPAVCSLTISGRQCWEAKTGVPGVLEAQILAGKSALVHTVGDRNITQDGTVIDGQWIDGCLSIHANNVTIRNSLIRSTDWCSGGDGQSGPGLINTGGCHDTSKSPTGLTITDSELDAGNVGSGGSYAAVTSCNYSLLRVNAHGGALTLWTGTNVVVRDSFIHDPTNNAAPDHTESIDADSGNHVTIAHNYISALTTPSTSFSTGGLSINNSWGPASYFTVTDNFLEGGAGADVNFGCGCTGRPWSSATNTVFTGNRLSPNTAWGNQFFYGWNGSLPGNVWSDNRQSETLAVIAP